MNYEQPLEETTNKILEVEALLSRHQQREERLKQEQQQLGEKLAQIDEELKQEQESIEEVQRELQDLRQVRNISQRLVSVQGECNQRGLAWFIQELERIESSILEGSGLPKSAELRVSIRENWRDSLVELGKKQSEDNKIAQAIQSFENAKLLCDKGEEKVLQYIRRRLATLLEAQGDHRNSIQDYQYAADEAEAIEDHHRKERVLGKMARLYEDKQEYLEALRRLYERLDSLALVVGKVSQDILICLDNIQRLGSRLGEIASFDEQQAYEWAINYFVNKKDLAGLERVKALANGRNLLEISNKSQRHKSRLELTMRQQEAGGEQ